MALISKKNRKERRRFLAIVFINVKLGWLILSLQTQERAFHPKHGTLHKRVHRVLIQPPPPFTFFSHSRAQLSWWRPKVSGDNQPKSCCPKQPSRGAGSQSVNPFIPQNQFVLLIPPANFAKVPELFNQSQLLYVVFTGTGIFGVGTGFSVCVVLKVKFGQLAQLSPT